MEYDSISHGNVLRLSSVSTKLYYIGHDAHIWGWVRDNVVWQCVNIEYLGEWTIKYLSKMFNLILLAQQWSSGQEFEIKMERMQGARSETMR